MNQYMLREEIIRCAKRMEEYGLISLTGGNVSVRLPDDSVLVTPSAVDYRTMNTADIVRLSMDGTVLEGKLRPSSDYRALLYMYRHMPEVRAVIHTHQPMAVAFSLITDQLPQITTTMVDEVCGEVSVAPFTVSSDEGMGRLAVEYAGDAQAVILKQHGVLAFGDDLEEALSAAVYLEESCRIYLMVRSAGFSVPALTSEQIEAENNTGEFYGQKQEE